MAASARAAFSRGTRLQPNERRRIGKRCWRRKHTGAKQQRPLRLKHHLLDTGVGRVCACLSCGGEEPRSSKGRPAGRSNHYVQESPGDGCINLTRLLGQPREGGVVDKAPAEQRRAVWFMTPVAMEKERRKERKEEEEEEGKRWLLRMVKATPGERRKVEDASGGRRWKEGSCGSSSAREVALTDLQTSPAHSAHSKSHFCEHVCYRPGGVRSYHTRHEFSSHTSPVKQSNRMWGDRQTRAPASTGQACSGDVWQPCGTKSQAPKQYISWSN